MEDERIPGAPAPETVPAPTSAAAEAAAADASALTEAMPLAEAPEAVPGEPDAPAAPLEPEDDALTFSAVVPEEDAELEKAMERAIETAPDDEPDDGTDLTGAFAHVEKARFDARVLLIPLLGVIAVGVLIWALLTRGNPEGKLVINEVMTSNQSTLEDSTLGTPDWVELYNGSSSDVNVAGFGLSDSMKNSYRYTLPDVTIPAGGYLLVYFTGGTQAADANPLCAGFGLSKDGDQLVLVDAHYELLCEVDVPAMDADAAYARRDNGTYGVTYAPTPNAANSVPAE